MRTDESVQKIVDHCDNWTKCPAENVAGGTGRMTKNLYPYTEIFSPIQINRTIIKNRIVMGPMGNIDMCEETGRPNNKMLQYFFARAKGGVGLLTTGLIPISHGIDNSVTEKRGLSYFPRIDDTRTNFMGWRDLAQGVHAYGSKIFIQLTPGLGRVGNPQCFLTQHKFPVSASLNPNYYVKDVPCMPLSDRKLGRIIKNCAQATMDAKACGLDGAYLHGHEGYLLEQLTNPAFNRRTLGKYSDWQRFGIDLVKAMRKKVGDSYPIMYRIDLSLALNETYGEDGMKVSPLRKFTNGRTVSDTLEYMDNLVKAGVDMFDVDLGCYDNWWLPHPDATMPAGCFLPVSKIVKDHFRNNNVKSNLGLEVPVVAVGKLGYPDLAEQALRDGDCDMVMLARPLLSDPEWCNKAYAGKVEDICPCIGCQEGCINEFVEGGHPQCAVNPRTGFEDVLPSEPSLAPVKKNVCVVGGGPAGITFALTALKRGHKVTLVEKNSKLGGKILPGSVAKIKFDFENYLNYLNRQVEGALSNPDFTLALNTDGTTEYLAKKKFDAVVYACGTKNSCPPFKGLEKIKTVQATDLLDNRSLLGDANKIVIVGGGVVGCETASWLVNEMNKKDVTVVEMLKYFMQGVCTANRGHLLHQLFKADVKLVNGAKVDSFENGKVNIIRNINKHVPNPYNCWEPLKPINIDNPLDPYNNWTPFSSNNKSNTRFANADKQVVNESLDADLVILAMGGKADEKEYFEGLKGRVADEVYNIGDSHKPGKVLEATRSAYNLAIRI